MRRLWSTMLPGAAVLLLAISSSTVFGAGAIYYSAPEGVVGWCAGRSLPEDARNCARLQCIDVDGTDCELLLDCRRGWLAIALGEPGYGAACEETSSFNARQKALMACTAATGRICTTTHTVRDGDDVATKAENDDFDTAWYYQSLLGLAGYYRGSIDAKIGPKTKSQLRAFQSDQGLPATGEPSFGTFTALMRASGGEAKLAEAVAARLPDLVEPEGQLASDDGPKEAGAADSLQGDGAAEVADFACRPGKVPPISRTVSGTAHDILRMATDGDKDAFAALCFHADRGDAEYQNAVGVALARRNDREAAEIWLEAAVAGGNDEIRAMAESNLAELRGGKQ